jgi:drug/metabolite transporter, DME family
MMSRTVVLVETRVLPWALGVGRKSSGPLDRRMTIPVEAGRARVSGGAARPTRPPAALTLLPPTLIVLAAMLWGTDALWRTELLKTLPAPAIVFWEHVILVAATGWLLWRGRHELVTLRRSDWVAVALVGVGASAVATVLFTEAFRLASPTTVVLLQKAQPLVAIILAAVLLREPLPVFFWRLLPVALAGTYLISFGDSGPLASLSSAGVKPLGAILALVAAALWGAGTVLGRRLLARVSYPVMTALRFAAALPALAVITATSGWAVPGPGALPPLLALALIAGGVGLLLYYRGLRDTPAAVATLCELSFPITAIILNATVLGTPIAPNQVAGILLLWGSIGLMRHAPVRAGPEATPGPKLPIQGPVAPSLPGS